MNGVEKVAGVADGDDRRHVAPVLVAHPPAVGAEPGDVRQPRALDLLAEQERAAAEDGVHAAQRDQLLREGVQAGVAYQAFIDSANGVEATSTRSASFRRPRATR